MTRKQIRRVAVIGAGISGVVSAAHLLQNGIEVVVFERNPAAGGVWYASRIPSHYSSSFSARLHDDRQPLEPPYPSIKPSIADQPDITPGSPNEHVTLKHAPPG